MNKQELRTFIDEVRKYDTKSLAEASGLCSSTIYFWLDGKWKPSIRSINKVAPIIGYKLRLSRQ